MWNKNRARKKCTVKACVDKHVALNKLPHCSSRPWWRKKDYLAATQKCGIEYGQSGSNGNALCVLNSYLAIGVKHLNTMVLQVHFGKVRFKRLPLSQWSKFAWKLQREDTTADFQCIPAQRRSNCSRFLGEMNLLSPKGSRTTETRDSWPPLLQAWRIQLHDLITVCCSSPVLK